MLTTSAPMARHRVSSETWPPILLDVCQTTSLSSLALACSRSFAAWSFGTGSVMVHSSKAELSTLFHSGFSSLIVTSLLSTATALADSRSRSAAALIGLPGSLILPVVFTWGAGGAAAASASAAAGVVAESTGGVVGGGAGEGAGSAF